ncbi:type II toxin-antitoxin system RelE family toxin [Acaryochloris marina]|uniref:Plasmid stability protein, putative n=1 Tax=Acaryochloris marina (strain MBIC 11017) TaxID=329726 RepID=A8ZPZ1_ACAM1|nr:type II toxin-antitoxin system RelE/ParE family toxin [Acaryochloris marina]ABW33174.1 plasmid stability protein, putative [Acaryochloris marina MBIC11017]
MSYSVFLAPAAERQLKKLPNKVKAQIVPILKTLTDDPHPSGSAKLKGAEDLWKIRKGAYRVIYQIQDKKLTILVVNIAHRRDVYKDKS